MLSNALSANAAIAKVFIHHGVAANAKYTIALKSQPK